MTEPYEPSADAPPSPSPRPRPPAKNATASCLIGGVALVGLAVLSVCLISASTSGAGGSLTEQTVEGSGDAKIVLLEYQGAIAQMAGGEGMFQPGYDLVERIKKQLDRASEDAAVKAVLFDLDTPGGTVTASDRIWRLFKQFREKTGKPVVLHMGAVCASGGYYIASAADKVVCEPTTITGSIGVVLSTVNVHDFLTEHGIQDVTITSGPNKDLLNPLGPVREEHNVILRGMIDDAYARFTQLVSDGRGIPLEKVRELADGRIYTANQALELKLVDSIGYRDDALALTKQLAGVTEAKLVRYRKPPSLADALAGNVRFGGGTPSLSLETLDELTSPRLMAVWRGR